MNSYHKAILEATDNGKFPELGDNWRTYHQYAVMSDCDCKCSADTTDFAVMEVQDRAKT